MNMKNVLTQLENTLPKESKDGIINHFNAMYGTEVTRLDEDERIFAALYTDLVETLATVGSSLSESSKSDDLDDIAEEDKRDFKMSTAYASHMLQTAMELAKVSTIMMAINNANP